MIMQSFPLSKRSIYAGIVGGAEATACLSAPLIGGFLTDRLSWRWCFYIQLPLIGAAFMIVTFFFNSKKDQSSPSKLSEKLTQLDVLGMTFFVPSITSLMLGLQWGGTKYGWQDCRIIAIFCVFAVLLLLFGWLQYRKQDRATLPPRIISQRNIIFGFIFSCCNNAALSIIEYYVSLASFLLARKPQTPAMGSQTLNSNILESNISRCLFTSRQ
jgi:MFS family permease